MRYGLGCNGGKEYQYNIRNPCCGWSMRCGTTWRRLGLRLRWHAVDDEMNKEQLDDWPLDEWQQGEELPGHGQLEGANAFAEQFELVRMDETGNTIAGTLQDFMHALEIGRNAAIAEVANAEVLREQSI
ncbi:hypothetical protein P3T76_010581 [Phytophthora citrophthora]|uniref:Uncharacterized protein n=1 Tax=Phytophthora citrophthora TaxID=4793 RepID=A0AAD9GBK6_9STRA|nr:hypothetical protein P3T76_010581 [Phytophthora citrophthora]